MYVNLHCHSMHSILDGLSKEKDIVKRTKELGYTAAALTDHGVLSGVFSFIKEMNSEKIKAIAGCEFYLCKDNPEIKNKDNGQHSHLCVLAKNQEGWSSLIKSVNCANQEKHFYKKPRLNLETLAQISRGSVVVFSGHMGSDLANIIFEEPKLAYRANTYEDAKLLARKDWVKQASDLADKYIGLFGSDNFFLEIQLIDQENLPASTLVAEGLRWLGKKKGIPCIATADSHYCRKEDAADQRILLCSALKTNLKEVYKKIDDGEDVGLSAFFKSNRYHIPSLEEMMEIHTEEELKNTVLIANGCTTPKVSSAPKLPKFIYPKEFKSSLEYLKNLCRIGWKKKLKNLSKEKTQKYKERIEYEFRVIEAAGLIDYFLITQDYIGYAKQNNIFVNHGRGSAAGCLVSYLLGITNIDPIFAKLSFERFYNPARISPEHVSFEESPFDKFEFSF